MDRARGIYELAIAQAQLDMPEVRSALGSPCCRHVAPVTTPAAVGAHESASAASLCEPSPAGVLRHLPGGLPCAAIWTDCACWCAAPVEGVYRHGGQRGAARRHPPAVRAPAGAHRPREGGPVRSRSSSEVMHRTRQHYISNYCCMSTVSGGCTTSTAPHSVWFQQLQSQNVALFNFTTDATSGCARSGYLMLPSRRHRYRCCWMTAQKPASESFSSEVLTITLLGLDTVL